MAPSITQEVGRGIAKVLVCGLVAAYFGGAGWGLSLGLLWTLYPHLHHLAILRRWVAHPKQVVLPTPSGLWGDVFDGLLVMQKRHRRRKKRLSAILAEFQASTAALPDGAVVLGPVGEILWFNSAAQALLGFRTPQDVGQRIPNLVRHPDFAAYFANPDSATEVEIPSHVNSATTLSLRLIPYGHEQQRLLIVRDVSELRRVEIARRDFVANASHELRTPLTVLRGYLDVMEPESRRAGPLEGWRVPLQEMRTQAARMEALINDLLKLARLESDVILHRQDVLDVPAMLERQREEVTTASQGQHRFEFEVDPDLRLFGRETEVQSIFTNLIANAMQYTAPGGIVKVRWWGTEDGAHFQVADTGIGIGEKDLNRVTERFYRVDVGRSRASGGTGLGLSIVKHALEHHEGTLEIESELGVGSTFTGHFPPHRLHRQDREIKAES